MTQQYCSQVSTQSNRRSRKKQNKTNLCTNVFSSTIHNSQNVEVIQVSIMEKQMWYSHTMENCSAIERNEVLTHATPWMSLEYVMSARLLGRAVCTVYLHVAITHNPLWSGFRHHHTPDFVPLVYLFSSYLAVRYHQTNTHTHMQSFSIWIRLPSVKTVLFLMQLTWHWKLSD